MTPDQFREIIREELQPLKSAILILADNLPGAMPGEKSHVRRQMEEAMEAGR